MQSLFFFFFFFFRRLEENGLTELFGGRVDEELNVEIDNIVRETKEKRLTQRVEEILREMDAKYDDRIQLFGVLEEDEVNALALVTFDEVGEYSTHIKRLKIEYILKELSGIEVQLRTGPECWELRSNLLQSLMYYKELPNPDITSKASTLLRQTLDAILDHVEVKYNVDTVTQMLAACEKESIEAIDYKAIVAGAFGNVVTTLFWKLVQENIHEKINFFRLYPHQFALSDYEYAKLEFFRECMSSVPEEVISLSAGLLDAVRAYSVTTGNYSDLQRRQTPIPDV